MDFLSRHHHLERAPKSYKISESLVQEYLTRAWTLQFCADPPVHFKSEEMLNACWLPNSLHSSLISEEISMAFWDAFFTSSFTDVLHSGKGMRNYLLFHENSNLKTLPHSELSWFVEKEREQKLIHMLIPSKGSIRPIQRSDFHPTSNNSLPSISGLLDSLSLQLPIEEEHDRSGDELKHPLKTCMTAVTIFIFAASFET